MTFGSTRQIFLESFILESLSDEEDKIITDIENIYHNLSNQKKELTVGISEIYAELKKIHHNLSANDYESILDKLKKTKFINIVDEKIVRKSLRFLKKYEPSKVSPKKNKKIFVAPEDQVARKKDFDEFISTLESLPKFPSSVSANDARMASNVRKKLNDNFIAQVKKVMVGKNEDDEYKIRHNAFSIRKTILSPDADFFIWMKYHYNPENLDFTNDLLGKHSVETYIINSVFKKYREFLAKEKEDRDDEEEQRKIHGPELPHPDARKMYNDLGRLINLSEKLKVSEMKNKFSDYVSEQNAKKFRGLFLIILENKAKDLMEKIGKENISASVRNFVAKFGRIIDFFSNVQDERFFVWLSNTKKINFHNVIWEKDWGRVLDFDMDKEYADYMKIVKKYNR